MAFRPALPLVKVAGALFVLAQIASVFTAVDPWIPV